MDDEHPGRHVDYQTLRLIGFKAYQLAGRYGFARDEKEDLQQILIVECLQRQRHFDSRRGSAATFAEVIITNAVATMVESRKAQCRDYRRCQRSLNAPSNSADPSSPELAEVTSDDDYRCRMGRISRPFHQNLHLRHDLRRAIAALPPEQRRLCRLLMRLDGIAQVAKAAGVSRATLHRRMRAIRDAFSGARLSDYLP